MPMSISPASTARSTFSVVSSSTISTSPRLLSRAYSSAASSEKDPRMPMTPRLTRSPTAGHLLGETGELRGQLGRPLLVVQGVDHLHVVVEAEPGPGHAPVVDLDPGAQEVPHPAPATRPTGIEAPGAGQPVGQRH